MAPLTKELAREVRVILRQYRRWPTTQGKEFRSYVLSKYRTSGKERASRDYATLLTQVAEYNRLRALDTGAEKVAGSRETVRRAAAKAGLVLPD